MSRYRKSSAVPLIAAAVLLAAFVGIVLWATSGDEKKDAPTGVAPVAREEPAEENEARPEPEPEKVTPPREKMSAKEADYLLRSATAKWRVFTVDLCREKDWPEEKAVAFLEEVTWNDRDKEKQHAHGLASLARMLDVKADDQVALAEALAGQGQLDDFFAKNWPKVQVKWEPKAQEKVLEDAWKETRIRWGFPLDTPIDDMQHFKMAGLVTALQAWRGAAAVSMEGHGEDGAGMERWPNIVGTDARSQEIKMRAGLRVLLGMPDASVKQVVEELLRQLEKQSQEEFAKSAASKIDEAVRAAEQAE